MAEYIEIGQLWKCETCYHQRSNGCALGMFGCDHGESYRPAYNKLKKADVAPVRRGRWIDGADSFGAKQGAFRVCSMCNVCFPRDDAFVPPWLWRGCPNCGCRMDKDGE